MLFLNILTGLCVFILYSIIIVYYIHSFLGVKITLHSWAKSYLIMVNNSYYILLCSVRKYFVKNFCVDAHERYWPLVF